MEKIGDSSLWEIKYRPQTVKDLIVPENIKNLLQTYVNEGDIPNILFSSTAGRGKTSSAFALCNDIKADVMYINGSVENSIDTLRYKVMQFATTSSFADNGKVVIIDECERLSAPAQDGMKAMIEQTESNCRFILTTNNISKLIEPIISRCRVIDYNFSSEVKKNLIIDYFKRVCWILDNEKVKYDKKIIADLVQKFYPDFRKVINRIQNFSKMHNGNIADNQIIDGAATDLSQLFDEIKNKKFNNIRKMISNIDYNLFYTEFYKQLDDLLVDQSKPTAIMILGRYVYESSLSISPEISLCACITEIMKECQFR